MIFSSFEFCFLFLPVVVVANRLLLLGGKTRGRKVWLLSASILCYLLASPATLPLAAASIFANYFAARAMRFSRDRIVRRRWLILGLSANLTLLLAVKYGRLFASTLPSFVHFSPASMDWLIPLGVSFYTLQQIMYLVDIYEDALPPAPLLDHFLFVLFFPYISAGPIVRAGKTIQQFQAKAPPTGLQSSQGLILFTIGLLKKVVFAESFRRFADAGFDAAPASGLIDSWITAVSYTFQLYFDFSGYSDMAVGAGLLLGVALPPNFNSPYKALSLIDFWKRWHMTLTAFINTYMYTPVARAILPFTFGKAMVVTLFVMSLVGLWHGAAWTFLLFGFLHGLGLVANHLWRKTKIKLPAPAAWLLTFSFVVAAFVVFRSGGYREASDLFAGMAGRHGFHGTDHRSVFLDIPRIERTMKYAVMLAACLGCLLAPNSNELVHGFRPSLRWSLACAAGLALSFIFMNLGAVKDFIYRDF